MLHPTDAPDEREQEPHLDHTQVRRTPKHGRESSRDIGRSNTTALRLSENIYCAVTIMWSQGTGTSPPTSAQSTHFSVLIHSSISRSEGRGPTITERLDELQHAKGRAARYRCLLQHARPPHCSLWGSSPVPGSARTRFSLGIDPFSRKNFSEISMIIE